ncbi:MAG: hypothetical protein ABIH50_02745 [bacterium]
MLKKHPFHFVLFSIYPVIALFTSVGWGPHCIAVDNLFWPIMVNLIISSIVLALFCAFNRRLSASAIYSSIFIVWFYNFGIVSEALGGLRVGQYILGREGWLPSLWLLLLFASWFTAYKIIKSGKQSILDYFFNMMAIVLVSIQLLLCFSGYLSEVKANIKANGFMANERRSLSRCQTIKNNDHSTPDIYFIILDAYTNNQSLRELFGYDNSAFLNELRRRGFFVAEKGISNYPMTVLSLPSTLNMRYLDEMPKLFGRYSQNVSLLCQIWKKNEVKSLLKAKGYETIDNCNSVWFKPDRSEIERLSFVSKIFSNGYYMALLKKTVLLPWSKRLEFHVYREQTFSAFLDLEKVDNKLTPRFYYVHIFCPHGPFAFCPNEKNAAKGYIGQIQFINKKVLAAIDRIKGQAKIPPIIIIQGDHGACYGVNWNSKELPNRKYIAPQYGILNAMYLPGKNINFLPDNLSSVNTFRVIMNLYFGGHYPLLKNKHYYAMYPEPFNYHDVTGLVERFNLSIGQKAR